MPTTKATVTFPDGTTKTRRTRRTYTHVVALRYNQAQHAQVLRSRGFGPHWKAAREDQPDTMTGWLVQGFAGRPDLAAKLFAKTNDADHRAYYGPALEVIMVPVVMA